jgi:hypothetical protein
MNLELQTPANTADTNPYCESPSPMPPSDCANCLTWYAVNIINKQVFLNGNEAVARFPVTIQFEVIYEFTLCLKGRQPGKLLYTTSLIPQEELKIYIADRYRKTTSAEACFSVHSTFRSSVSALTESLSSGSVSSYSDNLKKSTSSSGASASFLGFVSGSEANSNSSSNENIESLQSASQNFQQVLTAASQSVEAQRSLVVSSYEDHENLLITTRTLKNYNNCHAITYYVRQVNEAYTFSARIASIRWRILKTPNDTNTPWQTIDDIDTITNQQLREIIQETIHEIEKRGDEIVSERCFTLPTDGTMLETELAYCSSCDDERMMELQLHLEKQKAEIKKLLFEAELLRLEIKEKKQALESGSEDDDEN